jgi:predicted transcriptional regulator
LKIKKLLISLEEKYLNLLKPNLNIMKTNNPNKISSICQKVNINVYNPSENVRPLMNSNTILKLKLHSKYKVINVYDKESKLVNTFNTVRGLAKHLGLSTTSVSLYIKTGRL